VTFVREDLAWAAGLFEGEGSFIVKKAGRGRTLSARILMTDLDVLQKFQSVVQMGKIDGPYNREGSPKPQWVWRVEKFELCQAVAAMLWTWLHARRRQAIRLALAAFHARELVGKGTGYGKLKGHHQEIFEMKQQGMSQIDIATKFDVSPSRISMLLSGKSPSLEAVR
jgi:hypothetical protein